MKNAFLFFLISWLHTTVYAQQDKYSNQRELRGNKQLIQEDYKLAPFQAIDIRPFLSKVTVDVGGTQSAVMVQIDSNLNPYLTVESVNGVLKLDFKDPNNKPFWLSVGTINVQVKTPVLKQVRNESNGNVTINNLAGQSFSLTNQGNGTITLQGSTEQFNLISTANGSIEAKKLLVQTANVTTQANATVELNAKQVRTLNAAHATVRNVAAVTQLQRTGQASEPAEDKLVTVILQNGTASSRKITLRFIEPGNPTYGVVSTTLAPYAKRQETYPIGTKIEQLNAQQQDVAMTGETVEGKLIVKLKASDNGRTYNLLD